MSLRTLLGFGPSKNDLLAEALKVQVEQQRTMQLWLGMFQPSARPQGWRADDFAEGVKEQAAERGVDLPDALKGADEQEKIQWLMQQMDSEEGW